MTGEMITGVFAVCVSIIGAAIGSAWWIGRELGELKTQIAGIDKHLSIGAAKIDELDRRVDEHVERIVRLETRGT